MIKMATATSTSSTLSIHPVSTNGIATVVSSSLSDPTGLSSSTLSASSSSTSFSTGSSTAVQSSTPTVPNKQLTLLLLHHKDKVLLGMKKRGFGAGKYNGFGGKIEPLETIQQAAVREMQEESGVTVLDPQYIGRLNFDFVGNPQRLEVHVFVGHEYSGEVIESEEMKPEWFPDTAIPFENMWLDDKYWFPYILKDQSFFGTFLFRGHTEIVSHELVSPYLFPSDIGKQQPVTEIQGPITA